MARKSEVTLAWADTLDVLRTKKRLEHRIAMRHELNELEAEAQAEFQYRVQNGLGFTPVAELDDEDADDEV